MYCGTMGTPRKHKLGGSTAFLARPRLGALKNIYSGAKGYSKPLASCGFDKKKKVKKPSMPKMEYRKKPDYADTAYREAVSRLRILLAESYTPIKRPLRELDSAGEETDNQSLISGVSRVSRYPHYHNNALIRKYPYYPAKCTSHYTGDDKGEPNKSDAPPELMTFIERQEDYIEQLERESRFCRDELSALLGKVKDVISENECLHEKQKNNLMKSVFDQFETETETETDLDLSRNKSPRGSRKPRVLEGPAIVFESRISELEAQLTQTKIDLKKAQEENDNLRKKVGDGGTPEGFDANRKQLESLHRDKVILQETVSKLQAALNLLRDKEHNTTDQVKRSLDVAEQAQYEKSAAEHEIRRLKDELERQHGKLREAINEQSRRVADERAAVERRYSQQIEQLTAELGVHWEQSSKFQLEVDKQRRENADLRRELAQKQALIDELKKDMQSKIITLQSDIGVSGAEKSALEQQISNLQMANERCERQGKQEGSRLQAEMQSLRQRLDRADADLIHSRRENIRLTEQIAGLEKEINMNAALADEKSKRHTGDIIALPPPKEPREEMSAMVQDMEAKHVATVAELEGMIQSQNQLMDKLSSECHALTQKLEESSTRHKKLRADNDELVCKLEHVWAALKRLQNAKHREEIRELQTNLDCLTSRFSRSQIKPTIEKDESNAPAQHQPPAASEEPAPMLSRTSSKSSIQPPPAVEAPPKTIQPEPPEQLYTKTEDSNRGNQPGATDQSEGKNQQYYAKPEEAKMVGDLDQQYYKSPEEKIEDPNQQYYTNPEGEKIGDLNQQYYKSPQEKIGDPNQQYYTKPVEGKHIDPNQQYYKNPEEKIEDPNQQYYTNPEEEKIGDLNQQYYKNPEEKIEDPNQQYYTKPVDPNQQYYTKPEEEKIGDLNQQYYENPGEKIEDPNQQYYTKPVEEKQQYYTNPDEVETVNQNQPEYAANYNPDEQKIEDPNQYEQPNQDYVQPQGYGYQDQQYDPNQEYMTQEQYDQQYANYDPNAQYPEGDATEPQK